jgi:transposase
VLVAVQPVDLRRSYDGLAALVSGAFGRDVFEGDAFVFLNRRATQVRVLYWDRDGYGGSRDKHHPVCQPRRSASPA